MCGIIGIVNKNKINENVGDEAMQLYEMQKNRGSQGFGFVSFDTTKFNRERTKYKSDIENKIAENNLQSMILHHRIPTSTPNLEDCNHPIKVSHKELAHDYYLSHNGIISNDDSLYEIHTKLGYKYETLVEEITKTKNNSYCYSRFNDSEALAIEVARFIEGLTTEIGTTGSVAFIVLQVSKKTNKPLRVFWGRNTSPLKMVLNDEKLTLRSEGAGEEVARDMLYSITLSNWELEITEVPIGKGLASGARDWNSYGWYNDDYARETNRQLSIFNLPPATNTTVELSDDDIPTIGEYEKEEVKKLDRLIEDAEMKIELCIHNVQEFKILKDKVSIEKLQTEIRQHKKNIDNWEIEKELIFNEIF